MDCPCCSNKAYANCCEPAHLGRVPALTCEALMRSRYSAYTLGLTDYLVNTTHPKSQARGLKRSIESSYQTTEWQGLEIKNTQNGEVKDKKGKVEFVAKFVEGGQPGELHELSRFSRYQGKWVYVDGTYSEVPKLNFDVP